MRGRGFWPRRRLLAGPGRLGTLAPGQSAMAATPGNRPLLRAPPAARPPGGAGPAGFVSAAPHTGAPGEQGVAPPIPRPVAVAGPGRGALF